MSIINKMLQELDKRHATAAPEVSATAAATTLAQQARPVKGSALGSNLFWRVMAGVMVIVVAWVIWVMWQIMPRSVVTDRAYQSLSQARPAISGEPKAQAPDVQQTIPAGADVVGATGGAAPTATPAQPADTRSTVQAGSSTKSAQQSAPAVVGAPAVDAPAKGGPQLAAKPNVPPATVPPATKPDAMRLDMLRLATEIAAPGRASARTGATNTGATKVDKGEDAAASRSGKVAATAAQARPAPSNAGREAQGQKPRPQSPPAALADAQIDKRVESTPRQRAEAEFARAMAHINQGRVAEGLDGLRASLAADPTYDTGRQTLVSLLLEARRTDEVSALLESGLSIDPGNLGFAMLAARIKVERGAPAEALSSLERLQDAGRDSAVFHGFIAALYQRLGKHPDAIRHYQNAVQLAPGTGSWWVGLAISQEALERKADAAESLGRARGTGTLTADLAAYVERRLRQLR